MKMGLQFSILGEKRMGAFMVASCLAWGAPLAAQSSEESASAAALERVQQEAAAARSEGMGRSRAPAALDPVVVDRRRVGQREYDDPIYRNGVPYYDEWTIRAGTTLLRVPAYMGWETVRRGSDFFATQAQTGEPGEFLALAMVNKGFMRAMKTKHPVFFSLLWVPQEHAFLEMSSESFAVFKEGVQEKVVADRKRRLERDDFKSFEDYLNFKFGRDEVVEDFVDGFMMRAIDEDNLVTYFAATNLIFEHRRERVVEPMIMVVSYALVEGKLIRLDMKRLYRGEDDVSALLEFARNYVRELRLVNALSGSRGKR